ncbi:uncharacterized protein VTP21DRAFT_5931 [Calcarisporiella thermophila]|uniref:uncharacterized protein n=1 Tax=Calcarisporiella thermophila TaxID=911321 RepID=UPI003741FBAB
MESSKSADPCTLLLNLARNLRESQAIKLPSPEHTPVRASVAIVLRVRPSSYVPLSKLPTTVEEFVKQPWVSGGDPQLLYIKRATRQGDRWSGHVAFPGGKQEEADNGDDRATAEREAREEVGLDLTGPEFLCLGALDDREVSSTFAKRLLMILSPFVYLQMSPITPQMTIQLREVASAHWIPLSIFYDYLEHPRWTPISVDLSRRLFPYFTSGLFRKFLRTIMGEMHFHCINMPNYIETPQSSDSPLTSHTSTSTTIAYSPTSATSSSKISEEIQGMLEQRIAPGKLRLWGLTLQMTSNLLDLMEHDARGPHRPLDGQMPRFDFIDINLLVLMFIKLGKRDERRGNWTTSWAGGPAWKSYLRAIRRAVVVSILLRLIGTAFMLRIAYRVFKRLM